MLPAPSTTETSTPRSRTLLSCLAICSTVSGSVPNSRSPISASPDSLTRTRSKAGLSVTLRPSSGSRPDLEAREAADDHVLAGGAGELDAHLLDRLAVVLVGVDV